jgi:hypothetical protein
MDECAFPLMVLLAKWPIISFFKELSIVQGGKKHSFSIFNQMELGLKSPLLVA